MKRFSCFLLLLISQLAFSQKQFTKFAEKRPVTWAAFVADTVRFKEPNLSLILRQRLIDNRIKAGTVSWEEPFAINKNTPKQTITERIAPDQVSQVVNENGDYVATVKVAEDPLLSTKYFDDDIKDLVEIAQVIYVEKGKVKSFATWVSPKQFVYTSWQQKLGMTNAFSTAFNTCRKFTRRQQKQSISLGSSATRLLPDSTSNLKMIKQLYEHQLLEEIWPAISSNKYEIIAIDSARSISFAGMTQSLLGDFTISTPVYDEEGNIEKYQTMPALALKATSFTGMELQQEWYYHIKKNKLFTRPTALLLHAPKRTKASSEPIASPILKILLK